MFPLLSSLREFWSRWKAASFNMRLVLGSNARTQPFEDRQEAICQQRAAVGRIFTFPEFGKYIFFACAIHKSGAVCVRVRARIACVSSAGGVSGGEGN